MLTDSGVPADYARTVLDQCADGTLYTVPQGETSKSLKVYGEVLGAMLAFGMGRRDLLVAVGGASWATWAASAPPAICAASTL